jgi:hypothetical protein
MMLKFLLPTLFVGFLFVTPALADVTCVQQGLTNLGFDPGPVDGALGKKTVGAAALLAANAGLSIEPLTKANADVWCTAITNFAETPEAKTISHLDLVSEPDAVLSERDQKRLWDAYKTASECFAHPTYGAGFGYKLPELRQEQFEATPWSSPFTAVTGAAECKVAPGRLLPPAPISKVVLDESYGERLEDIDAAASWFRQLTTYYRYSDDPIALELLRTALVNWAKEDGLGSGIHVSWGKKPVDYQMMATIVSFATTAAQIGPHLTAEERGVVGPWLNDLIKQVAASYWRDRTDNKQFMRAYTALLWGLITGDDRPVQDAIFTYKLAIHDMRPDGSWPIDSQRGAMGLLYNSGAASNIVMIATALKSARDIDLFSYEVDGRSVHDAVDWVVHSLRDPAAANRTYAISCPDSGDRFGSIEAPVTQFAEEAGYLLAYAGLFPDRESSAFIREFYADRPTPDSERYGGAAGCQFALNGGTPLLEPLVMPELPADLPEPSVVIYPEMLEQEGGPTPTASSVGMHLFGRIADAKADLGEFDFSLQLDGYVGVARNFMSLQLAVYYPPLTDDEQAKVAPCRAADGDRLRFTFKKDGDSFTSSNAQCVIDALDGRRLGVQVEFLLNHLQDIAINLVKNGDTQTLAHEGLRDFLDRLARGEITIGHAG